MDGLAFIAIPLMVVVTLVYLHRNQPPSLEEFSEQRRER